MKVLVFVLSFLFIVAAMAQHKFLQMNPLGAKKYMQKQVERMDLIKAHKLTGVLGETETGMLGIHDTSKLKPAQVKRAKELMEAENKDRKAIFDEIARVNKLTEKEKQMLLKSAFDTYRGTDAKGTFYYEKGAWYQKF